ncbi:putative iron/ascorbate oxidoreductase [Lasiodiplodia theobromae]|uniref:Putative iron/ascorbate oxidoreductase n=1 Tax=Lasiodiplodia theobromae TaxID=45133 RepID=A0A5N5DBW1_9PEZI|nr:putative iron/ascorbate oxidoreductase [Lasiodiplodia theobromae]
MGSRDSGVGNTPVPIVDFGPFYTGDGDAKRAVAKQLDNALSTVGFVYLKNHGVPQERVDEAFAWSKKFFDLPTSTKNLAPHPPGGSHHRGYSGLGIEKVSQHVFDEETISALRQVPDVKESYETGNVTDTRQPNIWLPDDKLPGFRAFMESFFIDCDGMIHTLLRALALSLSLPTEDYLSAAHSRSPFQLRLLHYPPVPLRALAGSQGEEDGEGKATASRIGAHSDFGSLTILFQDAVGGLEVEDPHQQGSFHPAPPVEGTLLVNVGDLLERWSNGRWRSTVHRVGAPPVERLREAGAVVEGAGGREEMCKARYSIPFFSAPNDDAVIEALPGCWDEGANPKKYEAVTAEQYVTMRMEALYSS